MHLWHQTSPGYSLNIIGFYHPRTWTFYLSKIEWFVHYHHACLPAKAGSSEDTGWFLMSCTHSYRPPMIKNDSVASMKSLQ